jgi:hypothetical protein
MANSPRRSAGKRKSRRRATEVNSYLQLRAWKVWAVNACIAAPFYGSVTIHLPQLPPESRALVAALIGSGLSTWMNGRNGAPRR